MRVHVAGVGGMLGSTLFTYLGANPELQILGTMRREWPGSAGNEIGLRSNASLVDNISTSDHGAYAKLLAEFKPDVIINCIGLRQHPKNPEEVAKMISANSVWPHRLAEIAGDLGARLIHFSTDGVFSGRGDGSYREDVAPDPVDVYGRSKLLGEPDYAHCLTFRTSMIGHSNTNSDQLVDWLVRQSGKIKGYTQVIFSGLPTIEIASIIRSLVLPRNDLSGIWHLAADPVSKFELLGLIVKRYGLEIEVMPEPLPVINRSLDASRFRDLTGYVTPSWKDLVDKMYQFHAKNLQDKR